MITTPRSDPKIRYICLENQKRSVACPTTMMNEEGIEFSARIVCRRLAEENLKCRRHTQKPRLTEVMKNKCFEWKRQLRNMNAADWNRNDFVDVYGEEYSGKVGTDIQEGKYSWLIIKAIERASPVQEKLLRKCYGRWDLECVEQVKLIYEELDLRNTYDEEVRDIYQKVLTLILRMRSETARDLMFAITCTCMGYDFHLRR